MTSQKDLKSIIRSRQQITGESYTTARLQVLKARIVPSIPEYIESNLLAMVIGFKGRNILIKELNTDADLVLRTKSLVAWKAFPGQLIEVTVERHSTYQGSKCVNATVEKSWTDIPALNLTPLPLQNHGLVDLRKCHEPFPKSDPYGSAWRRLTAVPRDAYEFDGIAWGAFEDDDFDDFDDTVSSASELHYDDPKAAYELLISLLQKDIRCIDAHVHLGNFAFDSQPEIAIEHYKIAVAIGNLSLPKGFKGLLRWGSLYNRPFLRALHGLGLCYWRLNNIDEAAKIFRRILRLNPADNQGVRFCRQAIKDNIAWENFDK